MVPGTPSHHAAHLAVTRHTAASRGTRPPPESRSLTPAGPGVLDAVTGHGPQRALTPSAALTPPHSQPTGVGEKLTGAGEKVVRPRITAATQPRPQNLLAPEPSGRSANDREASPYASARMDGDREPAVGLSVREPGRLIHRGGEHEQGTLAVPARRAGQHPHLPCHGS
mgnify:CR=1 FL=1